MSETVFRSLLHRFGIIDLVRERCVNEILIPFATKGQIALDEARFLGELAQEAQGDRPIVEIGMLFGSSTRILLLNKSKDQPLLAVDLFSWNPAHLTADQHHSVTTRGLMAFAGDGAGLQILRQDKDEFYQNYSGASPALVFLDAMHTYDDTRRDLEWAKAVDATIICGHDYGPEWPGVVRAVEEAGGVGEICGTLWRLNK